MRVDRPGLVWRSPRRRVFVLTFLAACVAAGAVLVAALAWRGPWAPMERAPAGPGHERQAQRLHLPSLVAPPSNGQFVVERWADGAWQPVERIAFSQFYRTDEVPVPATPAGGAVRLRIHKEGGGAAHIDSVLLDGEPAVAIKGAPGDKLARRDDDVADAAHGPIELEYAAAGSGAPHTLQFTARIEGLRLIERPFHYPPQNTHRPISEQSAFYAYPLGTRPGMLTVDGDLTGEDLGPPLFDAYIPVGSGHPQGSTVAWVRNDDERLYVALDFTSDNTLDGNLDYAAVHARTPTGLKEFRISEQDSRWGRVGFGYTPRVGYQHKIYEFAIPLAELGVSLDRVRDATLQLAFAAYGTSGVAGPVSPALAYNSTDKEYMLVYQAPNPTIGVDANAQRLTSLGLPTGSEFTVQSNFHQDQQFPFHAVAYDGIRNRYLVVWQEYLSGAPDIYGKLVSADGTVTSPPILISTDSGIQSYPAVAFDSVNSRYLVVWVDYRSDGSGDIHGQLLNADGQLLVSGTLTVTTDSTVNFPLATYINQQTNPVIAFDPGSSRYLVAWADDRAGTTGTKWDLYGALVQADGTLVDVDTSMTADPAADSFAISNAVELGTSFPVVANLAVNPANGQFLVVWYDQRVDLDVNVYGQVVDATGTLQYTASDVNIPIASTTVIEADPAVAFHELGGAWLVAWSDSGNTATTGPDIAGRWVAADGSLSGSAFPLAYDIDYALAKPALAYNAYCNVIVAAYEVGSAPPDIAVTTLISGPSVAAIQGPPGGGARAAGGFAALLGVVMALATLLWSPMRGHSLFGALLLAVALSLLVAGGVTACSGSSSNPPPVVDCP